MSSSLTAGTLSPSTHTLRYLRRINSYCPGIPLHRLNASVVQSGGTKRVLPRGLKCEVFCIFGEVGGFDAGGLTIETAASLQTLHRKSVLYAGPARHAQLQFQGKAGPGGWTHTVAAAKHAETRLSREAERLTRLSSEAPHRLYGARLENVFIIPPTSRWLGVLIEMNYQLFSPQDINDLLMADAGRLFDGFAASADDVAHCARRALAIAKDTGAFHGR